MKENKGVTVFKEIRYLFKKCDYFVGVNIVLCDAIEFDEKRIECEFLEMADVFLEIIIWLL